jgi:hypothetical protein
MEVMTHPVHDLPVGVPGESFLGEGCAEPVAAEALQRFPVVGRNALRGVKGGDCGRQGRDFGGGRWRERHEAHHPLVAAWHEQPIGHEAVPRRCHFVI